MNSSIKFLENVKLVCILFTFFIYLNYNIGDLSMDLTNGSQVLTLIKATSNIPLVKINRDEYLSKEFSKDFANIQDKILQLGPYEAGVPIEIIQQKAKSAINYETNKATAVSFANGIPGGFALFATIPADITQFMGHSMRIMQKLCYLSSMPGFSRIDDMTDEEANAVLIYLGVMFSSAGATLAVQQIANHLAEFALKEIPKMALTKVVGYNVLKDILKMVGIKLTKDTTAKSVAKIVPILGGIISGGITFIQLQKMSNRLYNEFEKNRLKQDIKYIPEHI